MANALFARRMARNLILTARVLPARVRGEHLYPLDLRIENGVIILPPQNPTPK
jgi:hypothetical protein